jgi:hypothetical protein
MYEPPSPSVNGWPRVMAETFATMPPGAIVMFVNTV